MPRANRHHLPGHVWHVAHRCHKQEFLLKFARDRRLWGCWLYQARQRYGLCALNYIVTSNHVHLLVRDEGKGDVGVGPRELIERAMKIAEIRLELGLIAAISAFKWPILGPLE